MDELNSYNYVANEKIISKENYTMVAKAKNQLLHIQINRTSETIC